MPNSLYDSARERLLLGSFNWTSDAFNLVLVDGTPSYTVSLTTHTFYSSVQGSVVSGPVALASKTIVAGAAAASNVTFTGVSGPSIESIVCYKQVTTAQDSPLLFYIDTATGLPITPNGGDIIVSWDLGPNKIFKP